MQRVKNYTRFQANHGTTKQICFLFKKTNNNRKQIDYTQLARHFSDLGINNFHHNDFNPIVGYKTLMIFRLTKNQQ